MAEHDNDRLFDRLAETLRRDPGLGSDVRNRVMEMIRSQAGPRQSHRGGRRWAVAGLGLGAMAAAAAAVVWLVAPAEVATPAPAGAGGHRFALEAPQAASVALVGDFNDWNPAAAPLTRINGGLWTVEIELPRGSHRYAFVVDGTRWMADPNAAGKVLDDFGDGNSIVTVEETS